jgi:beta-galactosidase
VAIIFDQQNRWALDDAQGPRNLGMEYEKTVNEHYRPFWEQGIAVDIIDADGDLSAYQLVIAPMLYMVRDGFAARAEAFVASGGHLVTTYWTASSMSPIFAISAASRARCAICWAFGRRRSTA